MEKQEHVVVINAPKEKVWSVLWSDKTFRDWASIIDPETYMVGDLKEGAEVQFISAANGYGVTSLVEKLIPGEFLILKHRADTKETGTEERKQQWTGGEERYALREEDGVTTLTYVCDVPPELQALFNDTLPKALARIKELSES